MKKTLRMMGLCALIALAAVACKKNEQKETMTFKATLPQPACEAKTHIGSGNWLMWNAGDQIKVYTADKTEASSATFTTTDADQTTADFSGTLAESSLYYAFYPTTGIELNADGKFMLPVSATQTFVESNFATNSYPMCATSTDGTFNFRSPYGILGIPMTGDATIGSIVLTDTTGMPLAGYYAMDATDTTFLGTGASITLDFGAGLTLDATTPTTAYFIVRAGAFANGFNAAVKGTDGSLIKNLGTLTDNTILKESIHMMPATTVTTTPPTPPAPNGALPNGFSVSPTQRVWFSQGNLQYIGSAGNGDDNNTGAYWQFAENQWDYLGDNGQGSTSSTADRDLFGWGTSGYNHNNAAYQPWRATTTFSQYYAYGSYSYHLYNQTGQADWGYNAILNGGNQENFGWRTLTNEEWGYVFNTRTNATSKRAHGTVNGVNGMILLPDEWTLPEGLEFFAGTSSNWGDINVYNAEQWAQMEANGAVFLPAAGYRSGGSLNYVGSRGNYWSSSCSNTSYAFYVGFSSGNLYPQLSYSRSFGYSVRLVRNVE